METTPCKPKSKFSLATKRANSDLTENSNESIVISQFDTAACLSSTPVQQKSTIEDDESPMVCTQELNGIDVVWDWNSPQDKRRHKKKKRLNLLESPKVPFRRHPSNTQIQTFEKLKQQLEALKEEIAQPENEECLALSPMDEAEYKRDGNIQGGQEIQDPPEEIDNLFDDSIDDQLVLFSQQIESELLENKQIKPVTSKFNFKKVETLKIEEENISNILDDSLNHILSQMNDDLELTQVVDLKSAAETKNKIVQIKSVKIETMVRTKSDDNIKINTGKVEFCRTQSFELANQRAEVVLSKGMLEEIERKRLEALAKREQKRRQGSQSHSPSPTKYSPEEIERKRRQALAKLEEKRQNEIIERNRQEALLRLQQKRMKNANIVKSTLAKRL